MDFDGKIPTDPPQNTSTTGAKFEEIFGDVAVVRRDSPAFGRCLELLLGA